MAATKYLDYNGLLYFWTLIKGKLALKADKATTLAGYGITDAKINNGTITLGSNSITPALASNTYTKSEIDNKLSSAINYRGSVATYSALPANPAIGDMYNVTETDENYVWAGATGTAGQPDYVAPHWDAVGAIINLAAITNAEIDTVVAS